MGNYFEWLTPEKKSFFEWYKSFFQWFLMEFPMGFLTGYIPVFRANTFGADPGTGFGCYIPVFRADSLGADPGAGFGGYIPGFRTDSVPVFRAGYAGFSPLLS